MATRMEGSVLTARRQTKYPWHEWLDGTFWVGRQGEDYTCKTSSFVSQLYKAAYDRGLSITVHPLTNGDVEWQVDLPQQEDRPSQQLSA